jgi:hypothetical protein
LTESFSYHARAAISADHERGTPRDSRRSAGFALFGILLANLTSFFGYSSLSPSEFADIRTLTAAEPRWSKAVDLYLRGVVVIGIDREI